MSAAFQASHRHKSGAWLRAPGVTEIVAQKPKDELHVRALKRLPLGTPYPVQCEQIVALLSDPRLAGAAVFLDRTGVGRPISDLFRKAGIPHIAVTITGGANEQQTDGDNLSVPKLHLISRLQAALHSGEFEDRKRTRRGTGVLSRAARISGIVYASGQSAIRRTTRKPRRLGACGSTRGLRRHPAASSSGRASHWICDVTIGSIRERKDALFIAHESHGNRGSRSSQKRDGVFPIEGRYTASVDMCNQIPSP